MVFLYSRYQDNTKSTFQTGFSPKYVQPIQVVLQEHKTRGLNYYIRFRKIVLPSKNRFDVERMCI